MGMLGTCQKHLKNMGKPMVTCGKTHEKAIHKYGGVDLLASFQ
jgi:hypothetical protein